MPLLVALLGSVTACRVDAAAPVPTMQLAPTSTPITTEPPITEPPTSEVSATNGATTTEDPRVAEVEAAVKASRDVQVEVLTNPDEPVARMEDVATGQALEATVRNTLSTRAEGREVVGTFTGIPIRTEITSDTTATHLQCGLDALATYSAEGELLVPADRTAFVLRYDLERGAAGTWKVGRISFEGSEEEACER